MPVPSSGGFKIYEVNFVHLGQASVVITSKPARSLTSNFPDQVGLKPTFAGPLIAEHATVTDLGKSI
jgi:hypothetical protein